MASGGCGRRPTRARQLPALNVRHVLQVAVPLACVAQVHRSHACSTGRSTEARPPSFLTAPHGVDFESAHGEVVGNMCSGFGVQVHPPSPNAS